MVPPWPSSWPFDPTDFCRVKWPYGLIYVAINKIIHMYYLNNSHDLMKKLCRLFYQLPCSRLEKFSSKVGGKLFP